MARTTRSKTEEEKKKKSRDRDLRMPLPESEVQKKHREEARNLSPPISGACMMTPTLCSNFAWHACLL